MQMENSIMRGFKMIVHPSTLTEKFTENAIHITVKLFSKHQRELPIILKLPLIINVLLNLRFAFIKMI